MFRKRIFFLIILWLALVLVGIRLFRTPSRHAIKDYQRLMALSNREKKEGDEGNFYSTKQKRANVSKQILYTQDNQRLQSRFSSKHSELRIDRREKGFELTEHFNDIECVMQEKLLGSSIEESHQEPRISEDPRETQQFIKHLIGKNATYFYKKGELQAEDVSLSRYCLTNHNWSDSFDSQDPLLCGHAKLIWISLFGTPLFKAYGFQATLNSEEKE